MVLALILQRVYLEYLTIHCELFVSSTEYLKNQASLSLTEIPAVFMLFTLNNIRSNNFIYRTVTKTQVNSVRELF